MNITIRSTDVGKFLLDKHGDVWQVVAYCDQPTAIVERVKDKVRDDQVVSCPLMAEHGFQRLLVAETRA